MIGKHENDKICPLCGGGLQKGVSTIPFMLSHGRVVVIKSVPAEICQDCHEPFTAGQATDRVLELVKQLKTLGSELSIVAYSEYVTA